MCYEIMKYELRQCAFLFIFYVALITFNYWINFMIYLLTYLLSNLCKFEKYRFII
jgi:hypothetical protein